jgi:hypothetical protein
MKITKLYAEIKPKKLLIYMIGLVVATEILGRIFPPLGLILKCFTAFNIALAFMIVTVFMYAMLSGDKWYFSEPEEGTLRVANFPEPKQKAKNDE